MGQEGFVSFVGFRKGVQAHVFRKGMQQKPMVCTCGLGPGRTATWAGGL